MGGVWRSSWVECGVAHGVECGVAHWKGVAKLISSVWRSSLVRCSLVHGRSVA
jgi:hypothetical protein